MAKIFQATLFFKSEHFKTSIAAAMTAMLVMYTLNGSISSKLPQTSTIKFIDIWIIYGLCIHFLILILFVLIEHLPDQDKVVFMEESESAKIQKTNLSTKAKVKHFATKILPIIQVLFITCYMISSFIIYHMG